MTKGFVIRRPGGGGTGRIISVQIVTVGWVLGVTVIIMKQTLQITNLISPMFSLHSKSSQCVFKLSGKTYTVEPRLYAHQGDMPKCLYYRSSVLKGHCHEYNFKNSTAQKHVYAFGNLLTVVKFSLKYYTSVLKLNIE